MSHPPIVASGEPGGEHEYAPHAPTPADLLGPLNDVEEKNAPPILHGAGDVELLRRGARVSVVGSPRASRAGLYRAEAYARGLVESDVVVVSGLAEGIDRAAHEGAIRSRRQDGGRARFRARCAVSRQQS